MDGFNVLMYHELIKKQDFDLNNASHIKVKQDYDDVLPNILFAYAEEFEKQMKYLYDMGYKTLGLKDVADYYYNNKSLPEKSVLLTFDDMYKSIYIYAYPILKKYGFKAVGFVVLDWLFDEPKAYSASSSVCICKAELEAMRDVFQFANHTTALHKRTNEKTVVETIDRENFIKDLNICEAFVDFKGAFAYPFGGYNQQVINNLKELNFRLGFTSKPGKNTKATNPFELHRNAVITNMDLKKFIDMLEK